MEALIAQYGINFDDFREAMNLFHAVVAGSSALWGYLKSNSIEPGFEPGDLDIWISSYVGNCFCSKCSKLKSRKSSLVSIVRLLMLNGYSDSGKFKDINEIADSNDYYDMDYIDKVVSYKNAAGKEIQLIFVKMASVHTYIRNTFDISACMTYWDSSKNEFYSMYPEMTLNKEFYSRPKPPKIEYTEKEKTRIQKYIKRGFKQIEWPCPPMVTRDSRDGLSDGKLKDIMATNILTLEEVEATEFLAASSWNIIVKVAEQYSAFNRKELLECLMKKRSYVEYMGDIADTPFNQSLEKRAYEEFGFSDYSIYELVPAFRIKNTDGQIKSIYHMYCYTVKQWNESTPDDCKAALISSPYNPAQGASGGSSAAAGAGEDMPMLLPAEEADVGEASGQGIPLWAQVLQPPEHLAHPQMTPEDIIEQIIAQESLRLDELFTA